jgi:hypothetical protein
VDYVGRAGQRKVVGFCQVKFIEIQDSRQKQQTTKFDKASRHSIDRTCDLLRDGQAF